MSRKVNCSLSTATLRTCLSVLYKGDADEKLKLCFNAYDLDGNGVIDRKELFSIIKGCRHSGQFPVQLTDNLIEDMVDKIFDENDMDGDGTLDFEEFRRAVNQKQILIQAFWRISGI